MTWLDRRLQAWRIRAAARFIQPGMSVLDIGCADCAALRYLPPLANYVGIDRLVYEGAVLAQSSANSGNKEFAAATCNATLLHGDFPETLPNVSPFDAVLLLAVLEHVPSLGREAVARACCRLLRPGGHVIITVPSPRTEYALWLLKSIKLIHGMCLDEHEQVDMDELLRVFKAEGFLVRKWARFQLGFNNLFLFERRNAL